MTADDGDRMYYITTSVVARELERSEAAVRKLADAGSLPVVARLSDGTRLFDPADVQRLRTERQAHVTRKALESTGTATASLTIPDTTSDLARHRFVTAAKGRGALERREADITGGR
jgi:hypothetical protein